MVTVLLFDPIHNKVVLIEQFKTGAFVRNHDTQASVPTSSPRLLEVVAGDVKPGESVKSVVRRET